MTTYGFQIVDMWEARSGGRTEFVYLLEWPDEAAKAAAWQAFMSDAEWAGIKRATAARHGALVGSIEDRILMPLDYPPAIGRSLLTAQA